MATPDPNAVLRLKHRLVLGPTSLSGSFPYGGTQLSYDARGRFRWRQITEPVVAEEWGFVTERQQASLQPVFGFVLMQWDKDLLPYVFGNTASGTGYFKVAGEQTARGPTAAAPALLVVPYNSAAKGILIRRPVFFVDPENDVTSVSAMEDATIAIVCDATKDDSGKDPWQFVEIGGMTL